MSKYENESCSTPVQQGPRVGLIATVPKSGTWYCHYFFHFYDHLLNGRKEIAIDVVTRPHGKPAIGLDVFFIAHTTCPGFQTYQGKYRENWDRLKFYHPGYNWALGLIKDRPHWYDPGKNRNSRIVHLYRNPLDQAVSYFQYIRKHKDVDLRYRADENGIKVPITSVSDFVHNVGLEAYLKQFLTYKIIEETYPDQVLRLTYEQLVREPRETFRTILNHFFHDPDSPENIRPFLQALRASSMNNIKEIENTLGHSITDDQLEPGEGHIRDGTIGKWRHHLSGQDLDRIEARLTQFGLSLNNFEIE